MSGGQVALLVGLADQMAELFEGGAVVQLLDRLDADLAEQLVGSAVEDVHDRAHDLQIDEGRGGEGLGQAFGDGQRQVLRRQLAQHHLYDGGQHEREDDGDHGDGAVGQAEAVQRGLQQRGDGRLGEEADHQAGDGDAQLRAREHEREPFQHLQGTGGTLVTRFGLAGEREPVGGDVRELLGDEVAGADGQNEDGQQAEDGAQRIPPRRVPRSGLGGRGLFPDGSVVLADKERSFWTCWACESGQRGGRMQCCPLMRGWPPGRPVLRGRPPWSRTR